METRTGGKTVPRNQKPGAATPTRDDRRGVDHQRLVQEVRDQVDAFDARTPRERESRQRFLADLERLPQPFDEHADQVHVTGSAIIAGPRGTVLHFHKRLRRWMQTGGHLEKGEAPWHAALRESREETGLPAAHPDGVPRFVHLDVHAAAKGHVHLDLRYLLVSPDVEPDPPPAESQAVRWFSWDDAAALADDALIDALERVRRRIT